MLRFSKRVQSAINAKRPLVALESTIISHGMPYPLNLETARQVEDIVKSQDCEPATIALINGHVQIGLEDDHMREFAEKGSSIVKTSRRDMSFVLSQGKLGATTVSGTIIAAKMAGINVFVTGGIGGVHRGASETFDISADLTELGKNSIAVVCAGVKSILDVPKTLEYLETMGVSVVSFGKTTDFPAFYTRKSGCKTNMNLESEVECAKMIKSNLDLKLNSGIVFAIPIPNEHELVDHNEMSAIIDEANQAAVKANISGYKVTPFLLDRIKAKTAGKSLQSNIELVKNNARVGSRIAFALNQIHRYHKSALVVGASMMDITTTIHEFDRRKHKFSGTELLGKFHQSLGGVGRNMTEAVLKSGNSQVFFLSSVGNDSFGKQILNGLENLGIGTNHVIIAKGPSGIYNALHDSFGKLIGAVSSLDKDVEICIDHFHNIASKFSIDFVALDGNISQNLIVEIVDYCLKNKIDTLFEPTSQAKCTKILGLTRNQRLGWITPNRDEAAELCRLISRNSEFNGEMKHGNEFQNLLHLADNALVKLGSDGIVHLSRTGQTKYGTLEYQSKHYSVEKRIDDAVSVTGAGDTFVGSMISGILSKTSIDSAIRQSMRNSARTLYSVEAVAQELERFH